MTREMLLKLMRERVISPGLPWLQAVLAGANVTRISDLPQETLLALVEERTDAWPG